MQVQNQYHINLNSGFDCIWMASKLLDYHLCDKNYDCSNCPLDIIMRNLTDGDPKSDKINYLLSETGFLDKMEGEVKKNEFKYNLIYLRNSLVLKNLYANIFYIGIDPFLFPILDNITAVKDYMKRIYYTKGQKLLILEGKWGEIALDVPMNFLLLDKLNWGPEDIISKKWIALIVANQNEIQDARISEDQWKAEKVRLLNILDEFRECCLKIKINDYKDGVKIDLLYQLIGGYEYRKLLSGFFNE